MLIALATMWGALPRAAPIKAVKRNAFFAIRRYPSNGNYSFICGLARGRGNKAEKPTSSRARTHARTLALARGVVPDLAYAKRTRAIFSNYLVPASKRGLRIVIGYANGYTRGNVTMLTAFLCRCRVPPRAGPMEALGTHRRPRRARAGVRVVTQQQTLARIAPSDCQPDGDTSSTCTDVSLYLAARKFLNYRACASRRNDRASRRGTISPRDTFRPTCSKSIHEYKFSIPARKICGWLSRRWIYRNFVARESLSATRLHDDKSRGRRVRSTRLTLIYLAARPAAPTRRLSLFGYAAWLPNPSARACTAIPLISTYIARRISSPRRSRARIVTTNLRARSVFIHSKR